MGDEVVDIVSKIRQFKTENKLSLKTQIESLDITSDNADFIASVDYDIKAVGGIQNLTTQNGESNLVFGAIVPDAE
jgi:valyl-tRNA synthetase